MSEFSDPEVMAYADGRLEDPLLAARIRTAAAGDPGLRDRIERFQASTRVLTQVLGPVADEPVPPALRALLQGPAPSKVHVLRPAPARRLLTPRRYLALAASLVGGVAVVLAIRTGAPAPTTLVASALAHPALESARSGEPMTARVGSGELEMVITGSFRRSTDATVCRQYEATDVQDTTRHVEGLACRDADGTWVAQAMPAAPASETGGYAAASGAATMSDLTPIPPDQEESWLARRWRP